MCGFAAYFGYGPRRPPADHAELARMGDAMARRGPDGQGLWVAEDGAAGLAHRRLSIIDLSEAGHQPMLSADQMLAIAFNGEIYNYRELRGALEQQGALFRSASDTEVLLELYRREGPAMLERLRGMFALALWDGRAGHMLFARDSFGMKPLYIADDGQAIRAASQVKALIAGGRIDTAPSPAGHASFFLWGHVAEPFTLYRAIRPLGPGEALTVAADGTRKTWRFADPCADLAAPARSHGAPPATLAEALADSVRAHLVSDVPVGLFLSGGLDSTVLAAMAGPVRSVTLGFEEFRGHPADEVPLAEAVARQYGCDHRTSIIGREDFTAARGAILAAMDQPSVDGVNTWLVAREAARRGLKVALSGLGGDELFAGYNTFTQVPRMAAALRPLAGLPWLGRGFRWATAAWLHRFAPPKAAGLLELGTSLSGAYLLRRGLYMPWELPGLLGEDFARAGLSELAPLARLDAVHADLAGPRGKMAALETCVYMRNQLLRDADWAGMAHGVEIRMPLVDRPLLRAVAAMAAAGHPPSKRDMAACAVPPLPQAVLNRRKTGFTVPVADWVQGGAGPMGRGLRGWARQVHAEFSQVQLTALRPSA